MGRLTVEVDRMPLHAERAEHGPERQVEVEQHRPLLDVELEVGRRGGQLATTVQHPVEVDADRPEGVGQADAPGVDEAPRLVHVEVAGARARPEQALAETGPLLVGPVDDADRDGGPPSERVVNPAQHLDAGERVEAAIEPAAVRHRVDVAADEQGPVTRARQRRPEVARGVIVHLDGQARKAIAEPGTGGQPRRGEGHPLGTVFVARQRPERLEFPNGSRRLEHGVGSRESCGHRSQSLSARCGLSVSETPTYT